MERDRNYQAEYYDIHTTQVDDTIFYSGFLSKDSSVLELGCGTGRVGFELSKLCRKVVGVDLSPGMLEQAKNKKSADNIEYLLGDITQLDLEQKFDFIIAPFRVLQTLEKMEQVQDLFSVIKKHLSEKGTAVLNVFNPNLPMDRIGTEWLRDEETFCGEYKLSNGDLLKVFDTRTRIDAPNQVMYPEIIYRRYRHDQLLDEHVNPICMHYFYPDQFRELIETSGFKITGAWGGYNNQVYGKGPELIISFTVEA